MVGLDVRCALPGCSVQCSVDRISGMVSLERFLNYLLQVRDYCCRAHAGQHNSFEQVRNVVLGYCELVGCSNPVHANPSGQVYGTSCTYDIPDGRFSVIVPVNMPCRHTAPNQRPLSTLCPMHR